MTKDGRPSLINDIRLFVGETYPKSKYLERLEEAVAFARRMAMYLNGEGFSLGAFPALYVLFTPTIEIGSALLTDQGGEWWHRYVYVGVSEDFPNTPDALPVAMNGTIVALLAARPDKAQIIDQAGKIVHEQAEKLRFLLKRKETSKHVTEISFNIGGWKSPSHLFIGQTEKATGTYREADPIPMMFYAEVFDLAKGIRIQDAKNLTAREPKPVLSQRVRRNAVVAE